MQYKNLESFPSAIRNAIVNDGYSMGDADISVTKLIDSPQIRKLREQHKDELVIDARRAIPSLIGKAFHALMEQHGASERGTIVEERLYHTIRGKVLSGAMDIQIVNNGLVDILDYKTWSAGDLKFDKIDAERQLNVYAYLCRKNGRTVRSLTIIAVLKDWKEITATLDKSYPQSPVQMLPIRLWPSDEAEAYVEERINLHFFTDEVSCSNDERWMRGSAWAVIKDGNKRASAVYDNETDALSHWRKTPNSRVEERPGEPIRCNRDYCDVARFCPQHKNYVTEKKNVQEIF